MERTFYLAWRDAATKPESNQDWFKDNKRLYTLKKLKNAIKDRVVTHLVCSNYDSQELIKLTPQLTHLAVDGHRGDNDYSSSWSELKQLRCLVISDGDCSRQEALLNTLLPSLRELHLGNCTLWFSATWNYIKQLRHLERLDISSYQQEVDFVKELEESSDVFRELVSLSSLSLTGFRLKCITPSLSLLTNLEVLDLSCHDFSADGLPEVVTQLTSLKELNLSMCNLTTLPPSMAKLINLQKLGLQRSHFSSTGLPHVLGKLTSLTELNLSFCLVLPHSYSQPKRQRLQSFDVPGVGRLDVIASLASLKRLNLSGCNLIEFPVNISQLISLKELNLSSCQLSSVPESISQLISLKELNLSSCQLSSVPESLSNLTNLEVLDLSYQPHTNNATLTLPDMLFDRLTSLKELSIAGGRLTSLPSSLCRLQNLQMLNLSANNFSDGLPDVCGTLSSLKELNLSSCQLTDLPKRIGQLKTLEKLDLTMNIFEDGVLLDVVCDLTSLKTLNLSQCELISFPARLKHLRKLESLTLDENKFTSKGVLPVYDLTSLKFLRLMAMPCLESLDARILKLSNLEEIITGPDSFCNALRSPPLAIRLGGVEAIRQFYQEKTDNSGTLQPITIAVVIGHSGAGKTSLIKTLQSENKQRVLTGRSSDGELVDESTKVFNFEDVALASSSAIDHDFVEKTTLRFIDMGGQEIYHPTYQMTFRENCLVVVVVNMEQYEVLRSESTDREAVRQLYFDWLANFYLAEPTLASPKLVLTHRDKFSEEDFQSLMNAFLHASNTVRDEVTDEHCFSDQGPSLMSTDFSHVNHPVFCVDDVFTIGKENNYQVFEDIKASLHKTSRGHAKEVPNHWEEVRDAVKQLPGCFLSKSDVHGYLRDALHVRVDQLEVILSEMHRCGQLLWYKDIKLLNNYVFHNIPAVTELLKILYDHTASDKWKKRKPCDRLDEERYYQLVDRFRLTGVLDQMLLTDLIREESLFKSRKDIKLALTLLKSFNLVYGPIKLDNRDCYLVHNFFQGYMDESVHSGKEVQLRVELVFTGYAVPASAFHQMTLMLLESFCDSGNASACEVRRNGAAVKCVASKMAVSLTHNRKSQTVAIVLADRAHDVSNLWKSFIDFTNRIIAQTRKTWKASAMKCIFYCPHCLLTGNPHPTRTTNPSWCELSRQLTQSYNACGEDKNIPAALISPCQQLTAPELSVLKEYVSSQLRVREGKPAYGSLVQPEGEEGEANELMTFVEDESADGSSDLSDGEGYFYPAADRSKISMTGLRLVPTTRRSIKALFTNTDKVYKMSAPMRGRALIINNNRFGPSHTRDGSSVDVDNLTALLTALKFEHSVKTDLTANDMLSAIEYETENNHHVDYGMFILVIMSHGKRDNYICGTDSRDVSLSDVYDLLSAANFPQMKGKPKLVVIQACSGDRRDLGASGSHVPSTSSLATDSPGVGSSGVCLNAEDLIAIRSSFESYVSMRHTGYGTLFIRVLVATFYKHASHRHVEKLCEIVRERVRKESEKLMSEDRQHATGQIPVHMSTLTRYRKLYLFPGYN